MVDSIYQPPFYSDEPKLWNFSAKISDVSDISDCCCDIGYSGGASFKKTKAYIKAAGEAVERYCLGIYKDNKLKIASYKDIQKQSIALDEIISFSANQLKDKKFSMCRWNSESIFRWKKGYLFPDKKELYIPAQMVFVPFKLNNEKIIRFPISTGGACGSSEEECLLRGILEVIERDAFIIHYLSNTHGVLVNIETNPVLRKIKNYFKKYNLEIYLINLPTDIRIYSFLALVIDRTSIGPAISAGLKSGTNPLKTAIGAIEESWHSRPWIRDDLNKMPDISEIQKRAHLLVDLKERGLYWSPLEMLKHIEPWITNPKVLDFNDLKPITSKENIAYQLEYVTKVLTEKGHNIYYVDLTTESISKYKFKVLKVIIPTLHPLHLEEPFPYLGGSRIYNVPFEIGLAEKPLTGEYQLNKVPHFFL
ncbi:MAG: YcaO-like family protein [Patescibacteria group bacterium]|nr:YcaO-like family protein [Patescibacteria group bacterium]